MKFIVATLALAGYVSAICPGFNYGIGNVQPLGNGINRCKPSSAQWHFVLAQTHLSAGNVYDDSCNVQDGLTTDQNPCTQLSGIFSCATRPDDTVTFVGYKNTFTGLR